MAQLLNTTIPNGGLTVTGNMTVNNSTITTNSLTVSTAPSASTDVVRKADYGSMAFGQLKALGGTDTDSVYTFSGSSYVEVIRVIVTTVEYVSAQIKAYSYIIPYYNVPSIVTPKLPTDVVFNSTYGDKFSFSLAGTDLLLTLTSGGPAAYIYYSAELLGTASTDINQRR